VLCGEALERGLRLRVHQRFGLAMRIVNSDWAVLKVGSRISIENARERLGWEPRFAELEDGIADSIERLRAYIAAGGLSTARPAITGAPGS